MDDRRFDDLTRAISEGTSRRAMLKGVLGGSLAALLAAIGLGEVDAQELDADASCRRRCRRIKNRRRRRRCLRRCGGGGGGGTPPVVPGPTIIGGICVVSGDCVTANCVIGQVGGTCQNCPPRRKCGAAGGCCPIGLVCVPATGLCV